LHLRVYFRSSPDTRQKLKLHEKSAVSQTAQFF